jgi:Na+/H+-translocating membrane pyrophosphatase
MSEGVLVPWHSWHPVTENAGGIAQNTTIKPDMIGIVMWRSAGMPIMVLL